MSLSAIAGLRATLHVDTLASWLEALGTVGAFTVGLALAAVALLDRQKAHARFLSAHLVSGAILQPVGSEMAIVDPSRPHDLTKIEPGLVASGPDGLPLNALTGVVTFAVEALWFTWELSNLSDESFANIRPVVISHTGVRLLELDWIKLIPPRQTRGFRLVVDSARLDTTDEQRAIRIDFTDAAGRRWRRDGAQPLKRRWLN